MRPGSDKARALFAREVTADVLRGEWRRCGEGYETALALVAQSKKRPDLIALDHELHFELLPRALKRSPPHINHDELARLMKWKLTRGQMRPLQKLVESNSSALVEKCTAKCLEQLGLRSIATENKNNPGSEAVDWEGALQSLCELKAIGVATASALLAICRPESCAFMADEVIDAVITDKARDYSLPTYQRLRIALIEKAQELNNLQHRLDTQTPAEGNSMEWTAESVGRALWTSAHLPTEASSAPALDVNPSETSSTAPSKRRKLR